LQAKRNEILAEKKRKEEELKEKAEFILRIRQHAREEQVKKRASKKEKEELKIKQEKALLDSKILLLHEKLQKKKAGTNITQ
jgi:hypothetical protein